MPDSHDQQPPNPPWFYEPADADDASLRAMQTILPGQFLQAAAPTIPPPAAMVHPQVAADDTAVYRPQQRPPMAMLCIMHDGDAGGEWIALRADRYVIARNEGDIRVPHDVQISGRQHAEIVRTRLENGHFRWNLNDLGSTNGTFVRVASMALLPGVELMFGQTRYRFESSQIAAKAAPPSTLEGQMTARPGAPLPRPAAEASHPALVEITQTGDGPRIALTRNEYWLGRNPAECAIVPRDDPFVSPRHARIFKGDNGRWRVENSNSRNGVWFRISQSLPVNGLCQFLLGEQRFILKVLT
ncbi:MAG TPA: FHA domain-containing protein [Gemmataceae bacterium]|nr:FHA domain-containing protein [Gemmataceae bacterium]